MPQFIAAALLPLITNSPIFFLGPAAVSATATGLGYLAVGAALLVGQMLLTPKPDVPKAEDGTYNLKQAVPSPAYPLGRVKKGGDYLLLEEKNGLAYHVLCQSVRRINRYVAHFLHDEEVALDVNDDVYYPGHFDTKVRIQTRVGLNAETAYAILVTEIPEVYTPDHRGDGLATVMMRVESVSAEDHQDTFPQNMPVHTSILEGLLLFDPRKPGHDPHNPLTWEWTQNLPLERLWHLTDPVGSKLTIDDMYLPEWIDAANVAEEMVDIGGDFDPEPRYVGGFWFRSSDDPIAVGRTMDQAADMVVYERADGTVGVHPGKWVEPDIRLDDDDIISCNFDANRRLATTVLAVRGRFTNPNSRYSEVDAPIVGDPYQPAEDSTERTKTVQNSAVQSAAHMLRLQLLAFKRANAPRVRVVAHYEAAEQVPYRRFVRVHRPPLLDEAVLEIIGRPQLSLKAMTYTFEGIEVPPSLYVWDYPTPAPPPEIPQIVKGTIPVPVNLQLFLDYDIVGDGTVVGSFVRATWDPPVTTALLTEVEWQLLSGGPVSSLRSKTGETQLRTGILIQGETYRFRARNWSSATPSNWTSYKNITIAAASPPAALVSFGAVGGNGHSAWSFVTAVGDPQLHHINVYQVPTGVTLNKSVHRKVKVNLAGTSFGYIDGDNSAATNNLLANPAFSSAAPPPTLGTGWTAPGTGVATHAGSGGSLSWTGLTITLAGVYRLFVDINVMTLGSLTPRFTTPAEVWTTAYTTPGDKLQTYTALAANTGFNLLANTNNDSQVDEAILFKQTPSSSPQGFWDYYAFPANPFDNEGPGATPVINVRVV